MKSFFLRNDRTAFTLTEMVVSMAASVIVLGALVVSSMSIRRSLNSNEVYTGAYSDQRRITDFISRDLRRAIAVAVTDENGVRTEVNGKPVTVTIGERASLILQLPAYYRTNRAASADYEKPLDIVGSKDRLDYGTPAGHAKPVEVSFRKIFSAKERRVCFLREEEREDATVVRDADNLVVQVAVGGDGLTADIKTWYRSTQIGPTPIVSTHDTVLMRNPPLDYRP